MSDTEGRLDGTRVYYQSWGADTARAEVVLVHGYAEHSGRYDHVAKELVGAGLRVWALDHRGHGRSEGDRGDIGSWEAAVSDVDLLVDLAAASGRQVFVLGHSMGGAIATAYALAHQDRLAGLVLSAPALVVSDDLLGLRALPEIPAVDLSGAVSTDPAVVQAYKDDPLNYLGPIPRNLLEVFATTPELNARLGELTLPVLVMHGSGDLLIPPAALPLVVGGVASTDLTARLWPGLFHEILNEPTDGAVVREVVTWVSDRVA